MKNTGMPPTYDLNKIKFATNEAMSRRVRKVVWAVTIYIF